MSTDVGALGFPEGVDVSTSARLAAALEAVRREPGGWESALGLAVDAAVVAAVPERVGAGRIWWGGVSGLGGLRLSRSWSGSCVSW